MMCRTGPLCAMLRAAALMGNECTVTVDEEGWRILAKDPANVAMVRAAVSAGELPEGMAHGTFAIRCQDALHALSRSQDADVQVDNGVMTVSSKGFTRTMRLLEPEPVGRFPSMEMAASMMVDADSVREVISEFPAKRMQAIRMRLGSAGLDMWTGDESDTASLHLAADELVSMEGDASAVYPLDYWQTFMRSVPRGTVLDVSFGTDYPLMVSYECDGATVEWLVAPRIESE